MVLDENGWPKVKNNPPLYPILLLPIFILFSIPVRMVIKRFNLPLAPNSFLILFSGIITAILLSVPALHRNYNGISRIHPECFISIFLPVTIVSRIYRMDFYIFTRCLPQSIFISVIGFLANSLILGFIIRDILHPSWSTEEGVMAGVIVVPIQPNYVICLLKELARYKYLGTLLESETILSFIPALICLDLCIGFHEKIVTQWYHFVCIVLRSLIGGMFVGVILGKVTAVLMVWLYNEPLGALGVSIGMAYITYYVCVFILSCNGVLAVVCVVCFISVEKHRFSSEVDGCLFNFWGTLNYVMEIVVIMNCTSESIVHISKIIKFREVYGTIIIYFAANITRIFCFFLMGLILNRMAYEVNFRCLLVLGWSGVKGNLNLLLILLAYNDATASKMAKTYIMEVMVFTFLSLCINSTSIKMILKVIGMSELSSTRRTNMNNCMKFILEKRVCIMNILKLDRYLSDANWSLVRAETIMKHPYKLKVSHDAEDDDDDDEFLWNSRNIVCPDCLKEVPIEISDKEQEEMLKDAHIKVLKAKKVSVIKQYEKGTINKNCQQILANALEVMIESNPKSNYLELRGYLQQDPFLLFVLKMLMRVNSDRFYKAPKSTYRRLCFYLMMHKAYDFVIYSMIIISALLIAFVRTNPPAIYKAVLVVGVWLFFFNDFLIKVNGLARYGMLAGLSNYFRSYWNIFDFLVLIEELLFAAAIVYSYSTGMKWNIYFKIMKYIRVARLFKLAMLLRSASATMIRQVQFEIDKKICFGYDLATAIVNCCDEIIDIMSQLIEVRLIREILLKEVYREKRLLVKEMEQVQKERPWIPITVKTKQAIRTTLNAMEESLNELQISGFVDSTEHALIFKEIFEKQKFLRKMKFIQPSPPKVIFNEVPWMAQDTEIIDFLYKHVQKVSWDAGEIVCKDGNFSAGIYIVVTGLLRLKYAPKENIIDDAKDFGKIPIVDYLSTMQFDKKIDDNIMSGNSIGEYSLLTGRPYDCTITADSPSQAYLLSTEVIKEAIKLNNDPVKGLEARLWKCTTINLAVAILMDIPLYQSFTQEQIKFKLERAFMPNLRCYKMFVITELMDDVILIEGLASDYNGGELFVAPMLIPRTIQKLILPKSSYLTIDEPVETKLLIVPMGDAKEYEIMEYEEEVAELVSSFSSRCLLHMVHDDNVKKKKKKQQIMRKMDKQDMLTRDSEVSLYDDSVNKFEVLDGSKSALESHYNENKLKLMNKITTLTKLSDDETVKPDADPEANVKKVKNKKATQKK